MTGPPPTAAQAVPVAPDAPDRPAVRAALPSVSVVMPCYNAEAFIGQAIRSVLDQRYAGRLQLIVVDDGSSDRSAEVAESFPEVTLLRQRNGGPAAARNRGIALATGELVAFLDADDQWTAGSLMARVDCLLADPGISVAFGDLSQWFPDGEAGTAPSDEAWPLPDFLDPALASGWLYPHILLDTIISIITALVRRQVFDAVGVFDESLRMGEDYEFWIRVAQAHRFRKVDRVVARYRRHAGGTTLETRVEISEYEVVRAAMSRYGLAGAGRLALPRGALARRLYRLCFDHGYFHYWHGDPRVAADSFRKAIGHRALQPKALAYLAAAGLKCLGRRRAPRRLR